MTLLAMRGLNTDITEIPSMGETMGMGERLNIEGRTRMDGKPGMGIMGGRQHMVGLSEMGVTQEMTGWSQILDIDDIMMAAVLSFSWAALSQSQFWSEQLQI